jgi:hypothetical protein
MAMKKLQKSDGEKWQTADGKFNFTPDKIIKGKYKYVTIRIYHNQSRAGTDFYLKDDTSNFNPLPKCEYIDDYVNVYQRQFNYAISKLNKIYEDNLTLLGGMTRRKRRTFSIRNA